MSRAVAVARQDLEYAVRSYLLLAIVGVFGFFVVLAAGLPALISDGPLVGYAVVWFVTVLAGLLVPLIAVVASYLSIAGEREAGQLKLLLSLPPTRRDVVAGKFLGRTGVVVTSVLAAVVLAAGISFLLYGVVPLWPYAQTTLLTVLLALAFVGLAVGISAATSTRQRAMAAAVSLYVLFVAFWDLLIQTLRFFLQWGLGVELDGATVTFLTVLSPGKAYGRLVNSLVVPDIARGPAEDAISASPIDTTGAPVYLQDPAVLAVLVAWVLLPLVVGYWRFRGADLS